RQARTDSTGGARPNRSPGGYAVSTNTRSRMSRVLCVLALVALAAVIVPTAAQAKRLSSVVVCGSSGCRSVDGGQPLLDRFNVYLPPTHRPDRVDRSRWFVVHVTIAVPGTKLPPETWATRFYPGAGVTHDRADGWRKIPGASLTAYERAVATMTPFGAPSNAAPAEQPRHPAAPAGATGNTV